MAEKKRKISVRKVFQVLLTFVAAAGCIVAMVSASDMEAARPLKSMPVIQIRNDRRYHSVEQKKIMELAIYGRGVDIMHTPVSRLDIKGIEKAIMQDPWVADAQVYIDIDRVMHINVTRRVPVARIFRTDGESYYIDSTLHTMPLSPDYTYYATVVTNAPLVMKDDSIGLSLKKQIVKLCRTINTDSFWSAQVSQVDIDSAGTFALVPVIGNQRIVIGDTSRLKEKFANLMSFYKNVLNRIGWDKYEVLDVRYKAQVIASPRIAYNGPKDMAINKMNWITSIEVTEAQKAHEDSIRSAQAYAMAVASARASAAALAKKKAEAAARALAEKKAAERAHAANEKKAGKGAAAKHAPAKAGKKAAGKPHDKHQEAKKAAKTKAGVAKAGKARGVPHPAAKPGKKAAVPKKMAKVSGKQKEAKKETKTKTKPESAAKGKYTYPEGKSH